MTVFVGNIWVQSRVEGAATCLGSLDVLLTQHSSQYDTLQPSRLTPPPTWQSMVFILPEGPCSNSSQTTEPTVNAPKIAENFQHLDKKF
jgi:hypothetical protein